MDVRAEQALREAIRGVVGADLDELNARLDHLERYVSPPPFAYRDHVAARRATVVKLRQDGLSIAAIAEALKIATSTVARDLRETEHAAPAYVIGLDGKRQPSRKNGDRARA